MCHSYPVVPSRMAGGCSIHPQMDRSVTAYLWGMILIWVVRAVSATDACTPSRPTRWPDWAPRSFLVIKLGSPPLLAAPNLAEASRCSSQVIAGWPSFLPGALSGSSPGAPPVHPWWTASCLSRSDISRSRSAIPLPAFSRSAARDDIASPAVS